DIVHQRSHPLTERLDAGAFYFDGLMTGCVRVHAALTHDSQSGCVTDAALMQHLRRCGAGCANVRQKRLWERLAHGFVLPI
ncbi:MAG: hypothetical protein WBL20_08235, partial [Sphingobium sp.]